MGKFDGVLILSDMDGTLLNSAAQVSEENRRAIEYFQANGGYFSVATGRSKAGMEYFARDGLLNAPAVIYNGAAVYDFGDMRALYSLSVGERGYTLAERLIELFPDAGVEVYLEDASIIAHSSEITERHFRYVHAEPRYMDIAEIPHPWLTMVLTREPDSIGELEEYIKVNFPGEFFAQYSLPYYLEVLHREANKAWGTLKLAKHMNIKANDLYTIGDGRNDVELVSCTANGYAPANACAEIMALEPRMLPDNDAHAIAALIDELDKKYSRR
ncbi:MAG: HAD family hydrolase [Clostridia bacterium]|nr:HAD family hydrolase [Clostridia bacterium]